MSKHLHPSNLHDYQKKAVNLQCSTPHSALWLDCGLGKTPITLTSIAHLLAQRFLSGVLIVAPIRVVRLVWRQEALKWSHTQHLKFSVVSGTKDQRVRALMQKADVYLINYENLKWLAEVLQTYYIQKDKPLPFNGVVWDEISKMKNSSTNRVKAFLKIINSFAWATGLTGTPASNGYKDLHGQYLVLDKGKRLGTSKTAFKQRFYYKASNYREVPFPDTEETIKNLIGDITLQMSAEDYNPLPDLMVNDIQIDLPRELRAKYESLEKDYFFHLDSGDGVEVFNAAALTNKLLQFSNGAVYPVSGLPMWEKVHDLKLEALEDIIEESAGQQILCSYSYRSDAERIMDKFKKLRPINLTECKSEKSLTDAMRRWSNNDCPLMIGHPACLHPDTQVLAEKGGWVRLVDVRRDDRVFDGTEFVSHDGCQYSGYKEVIDVFGITMTPDHKLWINDEWVEGQCVDVSKEGEARAEYRREGENADCRELSKVALREEPRSEERKEKREAHVYDLVNCGPRHRFVIRNDKGQMFIAKNSMGHGIDGLQDTGHILVWYGLNWSLDLFHQFNSRLRRQGMGVPVTCHRILTRDTMDEVQADALDSKAVSEASLRNAIKRYRQRKGV